MGHYLGQNRSFITTTAVGSMLTSYNGSLLSNTAQPSQVAYRYLAPVCSTSMQITRACSSLLSLRWASTAADFTSPASCSGFRVWFRIRVRSMTVWPTGLGLPLGQQWRCSQSQGLGLGLPSSDCRSKRSSELPLVFTRHPDKTHSVFFKERSYSSKRSSSRSLSCYLISQ